MDRTLRTRLLRPRHLLATALVTLILSGVGLGMAAASQPAFTGARATLDSPFSIPLPAAGDHGRYLLQSDAKDYWPLQIEFQWLPDTDGFDANGARITVNRLMVGMQSWFVDDDGKPYAGWNNETIEFVAGSAQGAAHHWLSTDEQTVSSWLPGTSDTVHNSTWEAWSFGPARNSLPWCGLRNELQGKALDLLTPFDLTIGCWNGAASWNAERFVGNVTAVEGVAPQRAIRVMEWMVDTGRDPYPIQNLTFHEGVAYPVRMEFLNGAGTTYVLAAFEPGTTPLASVSATLAGPPPPVILGKRHVWGPDEAGVEHPFPASVAFALTRDDPSFQDLRNYLADHPDAYVGTAGYQEMRLNHEVDRAWVMVVTDGASKFPFSVHVRDLADGPAPLPHLRAYFRTDVSWGKDTSYLPPGEAPRLVPTVASLMAGWSYLHESPVALANDWSWDIGLHCGGEGDCRPNGHAFAAGRTEDVATGIPAMPVVGMNRAIIESHYAVNITGQPGSYGRSVGHQYERFVPFEESASSPAEAERSPFAPVAAYQRSQLGWLSTPQAAAACGLAVLAGALYWLWPALKLGPAALFSRVRSDDLLRNRLRQEIHQRIEAQPGIHHQALVRAVARSHGAVEHHLRKLMDAGLVSRVQGKGYTCYFPKGRVDFRTMTAAPLLKSPVARAIVEQVRANPGIRSSELARRLAVTPATVHYHVERMRHSGLLEGSLAAGALRLHVVAKAAI